MYVRARAFVTLGEGVLSLIEAVALQEKEIHIGENVSEVSEKYVSEEQGFEGETTFHLLAVPDGNNLRSFQYCKLSAKSSGVTKGQLH